MRETYIVSGDAVILSSPSTVGSSLKNDLLHVGPYIDIQLSSREE